MDDLKRLDRIRIKLGVFPLGGKVLLAMFDAGGLPVSSLDLSYVTGCSDPKSSKVKVTIHKLRKAIGSDKIQMLYGRGYWLTAGGLELMSATLGEDADAAPRMPGELRKFSWEAA